MDRPGVRQVTEGSGEQGKIEKSSCDIICGASTTPAVKGKMMMMMIMMNTNNAFAELLSFIKYIFYYISHSFVHLY